MMDEPVHQCRRQSAIHKYSVPLTEFQIGSDNQALLLIPLGNELEQKFRPLFSERQVAHFIEYDHIHFFKPFSEGGEFVLV